MKQREQTLIINILLVMILLRKSSASYFIDQINDMKTNMDQMSVKLNHLTSIYLTSLDEKMLTMTRTLTKVDQSVEALESRAPVWDTFQLHVTAWNEQIGSLDKKLDFLNRSQEKMIELEGKLENFIKTSERIEEMGTKMDRMERLMEGIDSRLGDHLVNEFASKGILQTLKNIDRKFDAVQRMTSGSDIETILNGSIDSNWIGTSSSAHKASKINSNNNNDSTCPKRDILLKKILNKLDNLIESVITIPSSTNKTNKSQQQQQQHHHRHHSYQDQLALFEKLKRRLNAPMKKSSRALEALERLEMIVHAHGASLSSAIIRGHECCQMARRDIATFTGNSELLLKRVEAEILGLRQWAKKSEARWDARLKSLIERKSNKNTEKIKVETTNQETLTNTSDDEDIDLVIEMEGSGDFSDEQWTSTTTTEAPAQTTQITLTTSTASESSLESELMACEDVDKSGVYSLPGWNGNQVDFHCQLDDMTGFIWTVIQQRHNGLVNFTRTWDEYAHGFGTEEEFWLGNNEIHRLTNFNEMILRIELSSFKSEFAWAEYNIFRISNESEHFKLLVAGYSGNATDSFEIHSGMSFSSWDQIHDHAPSCCPCAPAYGGGWWFDSCFESNLNGPYYDITIKRESFRGIIWEKWLGDYSLKSTKMMIRRADLEDP